MYHYLRFGRAIMDETIERLLSVGSEQLIETGGGFLHGAPVL